MLWNDILQNTYWSQQLLETFKFILCMRRKTSFSRCIACRRRGDRFMHLSLEKCNTIWFTFILGSNKALYFSSSRLKWNCSHQPKANIHQQTLRDAYYSQIYSDFRDKLGEMCQGKCRSGDAKHYQWESNATVSNHSRVTVD